MEVSYGIGVRNRYALFMADENVDPLDLLAKPLKDTSSKGATTINETTKIHSPESHSGSAAPVKDNQASQGKGKSVKKVTSNSNENQESKGSAKDRSSNAGQNKDMVNGDRAGGNRDRDQRNRSGAGRGGRPGNRGGHQEGGRGEDDNGRRFNREHRDKENFEGRGERREGRGRSDFNRGERRNRDEGGNHDGRENREQRREFKDSAADTSKDDAWEAKEWGGADAWGTTTFGDSTDNKKPRDRDENREARGASRGGGRGRGGFRGRGRGRGGFDNRGKREYDRHSGSDKSGIKPVEKRDGAGSFNWGSPVEDWGREPETQTSLEDAQESSEDNSKKENKIGDWNSGEESSKEEIKTEDETKVELSYEEWKKMEDEKKVTPKWNIRKPGEGEENNPEYKKGYVLKKKDDDNADDDEYEEIEVEIRHGREKKLLDIEINFKDENRDMRRGRGRGGPRGGRGSGRGRGDREGDRSDRRRGGRDASKQSAPKVDDMEAFPSLNA